MNCNSIKCWNDFVQYYWYCSICLIHLILIKQMIWNNANLIIPTRQNIQHCPISNNSFLLDDLIFFRFEYTISVLTVWNNCLQDLTIEGNCMGKGCNPKYNKICRFNKYSFHDKSYVDITLIKNRPEFMANVLIKWKPFYLKSTSYTNSATIRLKNIIITNIYKLHAQKFITNFDIVV